MAELKWDDYKAPIDEHYTITVGPPKHVAPYVRDNFSLVHLEVDGIVKFWTEVNKPIEEAKKDALAIVRNAMDARCKELSGYLELVDDFIEKK